MSPVPPGNHLHKLTSGRPAPARLYCFPYAGGSASAYRSWADIMPQGVELVAYQLPGRSERISEPAATDIRASVPEVASAIAADICDGPYGLFGHSMGASLAYEVALELRRQGAEGPRLLALSGRRAPSCDIEKHNEYRELSDDLFLDKIQSLGGTPAQLLENPDILELILPTLRADFIADETYMARPTVPLDCQFLVFGGNADPVTPVPSLRPWEEFSAGQATVHIYPGGHFFLWDHAPEILQLISTRLIDFK